MNRFSKKLLSFLLATITSAGICIINKSNVIIAEDSLKENEFRGDDNTIYVLTNYINDGNQSFVYECHRQSDKRTRYVVKVPKSDLELMDFVPDTKNPYPPLNKIISILRNYNPINSLALNKQPPSTPKKPKTFSRLSPLLKLHRPDPLSEMGGSDTDDIGIELNSRRCLLSEFDELEAEEHTVDVAAAVDITATPKTTPDDERHDIHLVRYPSPSVQPEMAYLRINVLDNLPVINRLRPLQNPTTHLAEIVSFRPYIERKYDCTLMNSIPQIKTRNDKYVASLLWDILTALNCLHSAEICHNDVKPDNIFMDSRGAFLGDLGVASTMETSTELHNIGTAPYMAPEMYTKLRRSIAICDRSDVFSLGVTALEMLTDFSAKEFAGRRDYERLYEERNKHLNQNVETYLESAGRIGQKSEWGNFLHACLNPDPARRATASQALELLEPIINS